MPFLFLLGSVLSFAATGGGDALNYTDTNSVQAARNLKQLTSQDPKTLREEEGVVWARARFAWVALLRLEGKDKEAEAVFAGCGNGKVNFCKKWGPEKEWKKMKAWGCARVKTAKELCE